MKPGLSLILLLLLAAIPRYAVAASLSLLAPSTAPLAVAEDINNNPPLIDEATISAWQGQSQQLPSALLKTQVAPKDLLAQAVGQTIVPQVAAPITYNYSLGEIYNYVLHLAGRLDHEPQEPKLEIQNGRAATFTPPEPGLEVDALQTSLNLIAALEQNQTTATLALATVDPNQTLASTNTLGIDQLLASGVSKFSGSPANRRHNIKVGVAKMTGLILSPNEEFSFNKFLGPVVEEAGFLPELVIKSNETVPELGGGLCQVSTTTFRAAIKAGLPITQRKNHAYAVKYYSPQGTDATIYPGSVDLKFINDTPGHLLIWPHFLDNNTLAFDFYGTSDGRQVTLKDPVQFDQKPDGSLKAAWERDISKNGQTTVDVFKSSYLPPALFHKQEQFIGPTGSPVTMLANPKSL